MTEPRLLTEDQATAYLGLLGGELGFEPRMTVPKAVIPNRRYESGAVVALIENAVRLAVAHFSNGNSGFARSIRISANVGLTIADVSVARFAISDRIFVLVLPTSRTKKNLTGLAWG